MCRLVLCLASALPHGLRLLNLRHRSRRSCSLRILLEVEVDARCVQVDDVVLRRRLWLSAALKRSISTGRNRRVSLAAACMSASGVACRDRNLAAA